MFHGVKGTFCNLSFLFLSFIRTESLSWDDILFPSSLVQLEEVTGQKKRLVIFNLAGKSQVCKILILGDNTYVMMSVQEVFHMLTSHLFLPETPGNVSCVINMRLHRTLLKYVGGWAVDRNFSQSATASLSEVFKLHCFKCYRILCLSSFSSRCGYLATMSVSPVSPIGWALCCHFNPLIALRKPADFQCIRLFSHGKDESNDLQASSTSVL